MNKLEPISVKKSGEFHPSQRLRMDDQPGVMEGLPRQVLITADRADVTPPMMQAAAKEGWLDGEAVVMESLLAFKRAGAAGVLTYFAPRAAALLKTKF